MPSYVNSLSSKGLLKDAPYHLNEGVQYEVVMGSLAYGVSNDNSDMDIYGFAIPPKTVLFPHLRGEIPGFDECEVEFAQYQKHHIADPCANGGKGRIYDLTLYSITKYFRLLMDNNPNIIDSLFVPDSCVLYSTPVGDLVRAQRKVFLHKGCWATFKGYAYGQMHKIRSKKPEGKRRAIVEEYGYDVKFAYHVVRLLNEVEQLLVEGDLDLVRNSEQLKSIRRGEWSLEKLETYFERKEADLESFYLRSTLPEQPDVSRIRSILVTCLEEHYGSLGEAVARPDAAQITLDRIKALLNSH